MAADVIQFRPRRVRALDPASLVRAARGDMTRSAFADVLSTHLGWPAKPGMIRAWESGVPVPLDVIQACRACIPGGDPVYGTLQGARVSEADARDVIAWVESTNAGDDAIGYFTQAVARAAEDHASLPPGVLLVQAGQLHSMIWALLNGGRQRHAQSRELLRLDADLLAHICQLLGDVQRDHDALAYGRASVALAREAGAGPAAAFSAQAQIARWRGRHADAADMAAQGLKSGPTPQIRTLLAYQEANAAAATGDGRRARGALELADSLDDGAVSYSAWSCPPGRRALYRLGVSLHLGDSRAALRQAAEAEPIWSRERPQAFGTWAHFQIAAARAHVMAASVDGAAQQVAPVLALSREYQISTLAAHMNDLAALLRERWGGSRQVVSLREQLQRFGSTAPAEMEDQ